MRPVQWSFRVWNCCSEILLYLPQGFGLVDDVKRDLSEGPGCREDRDVVAKSSLPSTSICRTMHGCIRVPSNGYPPPGARRGLCVDYIHGRVWETQSLTGPVLSSGLRTPK